MKQLWAPWRLEYIEKSHDPQAGAKKENPFAQIATEDPHEDNLMLFKNDTLMVLMNRYPYNNGHLLVLPLQELACPSEISAPLWTEITQAVKLCVETLKQALQPQGFNVGLNLGAAAGAGIPRHLHWHIIPRWQGDTNFMPTIAETRCLPQHRLATYRQLKPRFADFAQRLSQVKL